MKNKIIELTPEQILSDISSCWPNGAMLIDEDFRILWANDKLSRQAGLSTKTICGKYCYAVTHNRKTPCAPPYDTCPISEVRQTKKPTFALHTHFDEKGNKIFAEVVAFPIKEKGKVVRYLHLARNVTDKEVIKTELIETKNTLTQVFNTIPNMMQIIDKDGVVLWANDKLLSIKKNAVGKKCYKNLKIDKKQCEKCPLKKKIKLGKSITTITDGIVGDKTVMITHSAFKYQGEYALLEVISDITDLKRIESELNNKVNQLNFSLKANLNRHKEYLETKRENAELKKRLE